MIDRRTLVSGISQALLRGSFDVKDKTRITADVSSQDAKRSAPNDRCVGLAYSTWFPNTQWLSHWGTPSLGFYKSADPRIIASHLSEIEATGVDFIMLDWSNNLSSPNNSAQRLHWLESIETSSIDLIEILCKSKFRLKFCLMLGDPGAPDAISDGRMRQMIDRALRMFTSSSSVRERWFMWYGKPLLPMYVGTPSPYLDVADQFQDERVTLRFLTGYVSQQRRLLSGLISKYGYWSWEERGQQTYTVVDGEAEAMTVSASWRGGSGVPEEGRLGGKTYRDEWTRVREVGPKLVLITTFNEWVKGEQPSAEISKDIEPSIEFGSFYLDMTKLEIELFKRD